MGDVIDTTLVHIIKGTHTERKGNAPTGLNFIPSTDYYPDPLARVKKIVRYTGVFIVYRFVKSRFYCTYETKMAALTG